MLIALWFAHQEYYLAFVCTAYSLLTIWLVKGDVYLLIESLLDSKLLCFVFSVLIIIGSLFSHVFAKIIVAHSIYQITGVSPGNFPNGFVFLTYLEWILAWSIPVLVLIFLFLIFLNVFEKLIPDRQSAVEKRQNFLYEFIHAYHRKIYLPIACLFLILACSSFFLFGSNEVQRAGVVQRVLVFSDFAINKSCENLSKKSFISLNEYHDAGAKYVIEAKEKNGRFSFQIVPCYRKQE